MLISMCLCVFSVFRWFFLGKARAWSRFAVYHHPPQCPRYDAFLAAHGDELRKRPVPEIAQQYYGGRDLLEVYLREASQQPHRKLESLYDVFEQASLK